MRLARDVTVVVVAGVIGLVTALAIVAGQLGGLPWSADRVTVRAEFADAVGVNPGKHQTVRVAGVVVGAIEDTAATDRATSVVSMSIDRDITVYDNARAVLRPLNPLNEMYVHLDPGGPPGRALAEGAVIPLAQTERPTQLDEVLAHLDTRARDALTNLLTQSGLALRTAPEHLPGGLAAADGALRALAPVAEALQQRRDKIRTLVASLSEITTAVGRNDERLAELISSTEHVLGALAAQDAALRDALRELPGVTEELRAALAATSGLTAELDPLLGSLDTASATLPDALHRLAGLADELNATLPEAAAVVRDARPVLSDLRPLVSDGHAALADLRPVTQRLGPGTARLVDEMEALSAFVYHTASLAVARDVNGAMIRGQLQFDLLRPFAVGPEGCAPLPTYLPCLPGGVR